MPPTRQACRQFQVACGHLQVPEPSDSTQDPAALDGSGWRIPLRCPRLAIAVPGRVHQRRVSMNTQVVGLYTAQTLMGIPARIAEVHGSATSFPAG